MNSLDIDLVNSKVLLVGTSNIQDELLPDIPQVVNNVNDLKDVFKNPGIFGFDDNNIITLLNKDSNSIVAQMERISYEVKDTLILYYSGHAYNYSNKLFLTGKTSNAIHKHSSCVDYATIVSILRNSQVKKKILILDCCHSGTATNFMGSNQPYIHAGMEPNKGFAILTATGVGELAGFDNESRNTEYTESLISLLTRGMETDNVFIYLNDVHNYIKDNHVNRYEAIHGNTPTFLNKLGDEFKFANNIAVVKQKQKEAERNIPVDADSSLHDIHESVALAGSLQRSFFSPDTLFQEFDQSFLLSLPCKSIGGDFYYIKKYNGKVFVIIADSPNYGMPAALLTTLIIQSLDAFLRYSELPADYSAGDLLMKLNTEFGALTKYSTFDTQFLSETKMGVCVINRRYGLMSFSGAGINLLYYDIVEGQKILQGEHEGIMVGNVVENFSNYIIKISNIQRLYMYTDGFYDQTLRTGGTTYGQDGFIEFLSLLQKHDMPIQQEKLQNEFVQLKRAGEQQDDVLVIGIEFKPVVKVEPDVETSVVDHSSRETFERPANLSKYKVPEGVELTEQSLFIHPSTISPLIKCEASKGSVEINGVSLMENPKEFYTPLILWLQQYALYPADNTTLSIYLQGFNIHSTRQILALLKEVEAIHRNNNDSLIDWYYDEDDEDMLEAGEDFESLIRVPFRMIEVTR